MTERAFHHGNLRAALLDDALVVLRESGVGGLSLRELARRAGVSHGAPRSHFRDRQALLDAVAELGFTRLADDVRTALRRAGDPRARFRRTAQAYVDFAVDDAALMELMFRTKATSGPGATHDAATALFDVLDTALGPRPPHTPPGARDELKMLFSATMQGIAVLVISGRITRAQGVRLVDAASETMLGSKLAARALVTE